MPCVSETKSFKLLMENDPPGVHVVNPSGRTPVCLVCEHASAEIPSALGDLGLADGDRYSHAVWDIGAEKLVRRLSERFDAPLILGGVSRLVYDCNRPPERADAMPFRTETVDIPGNREISAVERAARVCEIYDVFHATLAEQLDGFAEHPALVTIHSFTPLWHGEQRKAEIGLLHDDDPSLAEAMQNAADEGFLVELNVPYSSADGVTHTLARHGTARGLQNVMIEVRNDLLSNDEEISKITATLEHMLNKVLLREGLKK